MKVNISVLLFIFLRIGLSFFLKSSCTLTNILYTVYQVNCVRKVEMKQRYIQVRCAQRTQSDVEKQSDKVQYT